jgi:hypothetical protein
MQRYGAALAFLLTITALTGVLVFAGSADVDRPTAAEAFFAKYQQRAPLTWKTGHQDAELFTTDDPAKRTASIDFDTERGAVYQRNYVDGRLTTQNLTTRDARTGGKVQFSFFRAEVKLAQPGLSDGPMERWDREPSSVRFRDDPRATELGARQLILEFPSLSDYETQLTQVLTIDPDSYRLLLAESSWGGWDREARTWRYRTLVTLSRLNEPVDIPASLP